MATTKQPKLIRRACGTMGAHMLLLERYPAFAEWPAGLENETTRRRALGFTAAEADEDKSSRQRRIQGADAKHFRRSNR